VVFLRTTLLGVRRLEFTGFRVVDIGI